MATTCPRCSAVFVNAQGVCLACGQVDLQATTLPSEEPQAELCLPFSATPRFADWAKQTPFAPADMARLAPRATRLWLPMWLVDGRAHGTWRGEVGFDYQVQSSRESLTAGQWTSTKLLETRVRWEPRAGQLVREQDNVPVPAVHHHDLLWERLGGFSLSEAQPMSSVEGAQRLPDLSTEAVWPDARRALRRALALDCLRAAGAQHLREFHVQERYTDLEWTLLLLPVFASWYTDDAGQRHLVLAHGRTGQVIGPRFASTAKGLKWGLFIAALALLGLLLTGLLVLGGLALPVVLGAAAVTGAVSLALALVALWPVLRPRHWNRKQGAEELPAE